MDQLQLFTIKMGLDSMHELLARFDHPEQQLNILHIAGTNGKGSVAATLHAILGAAGYRSGLYTSPHLSSVRERFRIEKAIISQQEFSALAGRLRDFFSQELRPTYFEFTTLLALLWFAEQKVELAIMETGLGGRLDATNVARPLVSIITDISRDHVAHLGHDIPAIAAEKAGIIKPGVPVVFSGRAPEALAVISDRCKQQNSPLFLLEKDFSITREHDGLCYHGINGLSCSQLSLKLRGSHQLVNIALALAALEVIQARFPVSCEAIRQGAREVDWPGRFEGIIWQREGLARLVLLDGAHNEAGVRALCQSIAEEFPDKKIFLVWANMQDKDLSAALARLMERVEAAIFTRSEVRRSAEPEQIRAQLPKEQWKKIRCNENPEQALAEIFAQSGKEDLICVAGSLYLIGRLRPLLLPGVELVRQEQE